LKVCGELNPREGKTNMVGTSHAQQSTQKAKKARRSMGQTLLPRQRVFKDTKKGPCPYHVLKKTGNLPHCACGRVKYNCPKRKRGSQWKNGGGNFVGFQRVE